MADSTQALVYEEALRGIMQQQAVLDGIRARASTLLGIASISTSFLGGAALGEQGPKGLSWVPIAAFVAVSLLAILILLPVRGWSFSLDADVLVNDWIKGDRPPDLPEMYLDLARFLGQSFTENEQRLMRLFRLFKLASALLVLQVVAWLIVLERS
jgi:hypothetical protein